MFATPHERRECLRTPMNVWRSPCDHCELVAKCIHKPIRHHIRHSVGAVLTTWRYVSHERTCFRSCAPGKTQTGLLIFRR